MQLFVMRMCAWPGPVHVGATAEMAVSQDTILVVCHGTNSKANTKGDFCTQLLIVEQLLRLSVSTARLSDKQSGFVLPEYTLQLGRQAGKWFPVRPA